MPCQQKKIKRVFLNNSNRKRAFSFLNISSLRSQSGLAILNGFSQSGFTFKFAEGIRPCQSGNGFSFTPTIRRNHLNKLFPNDWILISL